MVMHARKPQRINDGYFEKHQAHPYQNAKYNNAKGNYDSRYNHERIRESPNGNSFRSDSPDSQSPRDRGYQNKSYMPKIREKERENRDYKTRDKYSDCARSPKDKRSRESRDSEHRTNHDRSSAEHLIHPLKLSAQNASLRDSSQRKPLHSSCQEKREERERVMPARVGDWTEHMSSSGKKYYYNCKTEVSQWEKPREWVERERSRDKPREREADSRSYGNSSRSHDKHSNPRASNSRDPPSKPGLGRSSEKRDNYWNSQSSGSRDDQADAHDRRKHSDYERTAPRKEDCSAFPCGSFAGGETQSQDMDISPGDSTPTSEPEYTANHHDIPTGPVLLPRLASHPTHHNPHPGPGRAGYTPGKGSTPLSQKSPSPGQPTPATPLSTPSMVPPPNSTVVASNAPGPPLTGGGTPSRVSTQGAASAGKGPNVDLTPQKAMTAGNATVVLRQDSGSGSNTSQQNNHHLQPLKVETNHTAIGDGPPTPTHSESQDCADSRRPLDSGGGGGGGGGGGSSLSSLHTLGGVGGAVRPQEHHLTPSLANHYRDDLVNHVRGWPADVVEKQAHKLSDEGFIMSSLQCTRVSAELKSARSLVRLTEIQATLQEQRVLFLRQQIAMLEEMKSHNSFMSDDS